MKAFRLLGVALLTAAAVGCGGQQVTPQDIEIKEDTALKRATNLLESYAKGQALGSEVASYDYMVNDRLCYGIPVSRSIP